MPQMIVRDRAVPERKRPLAVDIPDEVDADLFGRGSGFGRRFLLFRAGGVGRFGRRFGRWFGGRFGRRFGAGVPGARGGGRSRGAFGLWGRRSSSSPRISSSPLP